MEMPNTIEVPENMKIESIEDSSTSTEEAIPVIDAIFKTANQDAIKEDISTEKSIGDNMCNVCNKTFRTSRHLRSHQRFHIPVNQRRFVCNECDKRFVTK